jgi:hypothetical protein
MYKGMYFVILQVNHADDPATCHITEKLLIQIDEK